jgi:hypothetical protein
VQFARANLVSVGPLAAPNSRFLSEGMGLPESAQHVGTRVQHKQGSRTGAGNTDCCCETRFQGPDGLSDGMAVD